MFFSNETQTTNAVSKNADQKALLCFNRKRCFNVCVRLVRYDKASGEKVGIQPLAKPNETALRWNWDAPLLISHHDNKTLYFSANKVLKADGNKLNRVNRVSGGILVAASGLLALTER